MMKTNRIFVIAWIVAIVCLLLLISTEIKARLKLRAEELAIARAQTQAIAFVQKLRTTKEGVITIKKVDINKNKKPWKKTLTLQGDNSVTATFVLPNKVQGFFYVRASTEYEPNTRFHIYTPGFRKESDGNVHNWMRSTDWRDYVELMPTEGLKGTLEHGSASFAEEWQYSY